MTGGSVGGTLVVWMSFVRAGEREDYVHICCVVHVYVAVWYERGGWSEPVSLAMAW
jgi:hypothetical protein